MLLRKALVSHRVIEDDCLMGFVLWHDNPRVFIRIGGTTVSPTKQGLLLIALYSVGV